MTVRRCHLLLLPLIVCGCRSTDKGGGGGLFGSRDATPASGGSAAQRAAADPILTNGKIPPQQLPVPGKDGYALTDGRDPLLGPPPARDDRPDKTAGRRTPPPSPTDAPAPSNVPRVSVPYRPNAAATPAALAARLDPNDPLYKVGDDPPPLSVGRADRTAAELTAELKKLGATLARPSLERGEWVARGEAELDPDGKPGQRRAYEAVGPTAAVALQRLSEQIRGDLKR